MIQTVEQKYILKWCAKLNKLGNGILHKLQESYKEDSLSKVRIFWWYKACKYKRKYIDDEQHAGRLSNFLTLDNEAIM